MKKTISYFLPYLKNYKKEIFFALIGMVVMAGASTGSAHLMKPTMDRMFIDKDRELMLLIPLAIVVLFTLKAIGNFVQSYYMVYVGEDIVRQLRDRMVMHLMRQDMEFLQDMRNGELISRVTSDINRIRSLISSILPRLVTNIVLVTALTGYVFYQNAHLAIYFFFIVPLLAIPVNYLSTKMKRYSHRSQESNSDMTARLSEIFNNIEVIKSSHAQEYELGRFKRESEKVFGYLMKQNAVSMMSSPVAEIIGSFALALVVYMGAGEVMESNMTVGDFFAFMAALAMLYSPVKILSRIHTKIQDAVAAFERIDSLLSREAGVEEGDMMAGDMERVEFRGVSLKYGDKTALEDIDLVAKRGGVYALVGDSGAGKSSLINLLVRFYEPTEGRIEIDGIDMRRYSLGSLLSKMAYVTQRIFIFNDTIANNVAYSSPMDREKVVEALRKAHAWDFVKELPDGIDTVLDEFGVNLSGGQRQRIALARAIYKNPAILILDEATSALDNKSERAIQDALEALKEDMITFVVAHRLSTVEGADTIFVFKEGRIVDMGRYDELLESSEEFRKLALSEKGDSRTGDENAQEEVQ